MLSQVTAESLDYVWGTLTPMIEKALQTGQGDSETSDSIKESVRAGDSLMWVIHEGKRIQGGIVLAVEQHPTCRKVFIELLAGDGLDEWADELEAKLIEFREFVGASCIEASVRKGLAKFLMNRGWTHKATIVEAPQ